MFARIFRVALKSDQINDYKLAVEQKVIPMLQKLNGFRDQVSLISTNQKEVIGITFWDRQEDAEAYERTVYADILKVLEPFIVDKPEVEKFLVTSTTFQKASAVVK